MDSEMCESICDVTTNNCSENNASKHVYSVFARNICKRYKNGWLVLNNFGMAVEKGTIYGLLGSSGCGKTTTLYCMVGIENWDSGELLVLGETPGTNSGRKRSNCLGFMPQELALQGELTVEEVFIFYGRLYNMSSEHIVKRWNCLKQLLEFPEDLGLLRDTSGGQRRRASLALAMLHNPELLILDEPTVGLDPVLRQKIWSYMHNIVKSQNITIIITTHYIEEARFSDKIGLMRNGTLIFEGAPTSLLEIYKCEFLEKAVQMLCYKDERKLKKSLETRHNHVVCTSTGYNLSFALVRQNYLASRKTKDIELETISIAKICKHFKRVYGLTVVLMLSFLRHPVFLGAITVLPAMQCCLTIAALGTPVKNIPFGIVNHEFANWTRECSFRNGTSGLCSLNGISCAFINQLEKHDFFIVVKNTYSTQQEALESAYLGKIKGYITFLRNYSNHVIDLAVERRFALNDTLEGSKVRVRLDHSDVLTALLSVKHLYGSYVESMSALATSCGILKHDLDLPIQFSSPPVHGDYSDNYVDFMLPGNIILSLYSLAGVLSAMVFISDYQQPTLRRSRLAGLTTADIIISHMIIQTVICIIQAVFLTGVCCFAFGWSIEGSPGIYILFCLLAGIFGTSYGLFMAAATRNEIQCLVIGAYSYVLYSLYGGANFPTETAWWFAQIFGYFVAPIKLPISALRSILVRKLPVTNYLVWSGFAAYGCWTFLCMFGFVMLSKKLKL